jgi:predicted double-glycine peptidase
MIEMIDDCLEELGASLEECKEVITPEGLQAWVENNQANLQSASLQAYREVVSTVASDSEPGSNDSAQTGSDVTVSDV